MFNHIITGPAVLGGKPCVRGTRLSVDFILELFASGASHDEILQTYPQLSQEAVEDALRYATHILKNSSDVIVDVDKNSEISSLLRGSVLRYSEPTEPIWNDD